MKDEVNEVVVVSGSPNLSELEKQKLERDVERAKRKQKQLMDARKKAPTDISMQKVYDSPRDALVKRLFPSAIPTPLKKGQIRQPGEFWNGAKVRVVFDIASRHNDKIAEGWEPVVEDGQHVSDGGDLMYVRPIELTRDKKQMLADIAKRRIKVDSEKIMSEASTSDGLLENVTEVTK